MKHQTGRARRLRRRLLRDGGSRLQPLRLRQARPARAAGSFPFRATGRGRSLVDKPRKHLSSLGLLQVEDHREANGDNTARMSAASALPRLWWPWQTMVARADYGNLWQLMADWRSEFSTSLIGRTPPPAIAGAIYRKASSSASQKEDDYTFRTAVSSRLTIDHLPKQKLYQQCPYRRRPSSASSAYCWPCSHHSSSYTTSSSEEDETMPNPVSLQETLLTSDQV